MVAARTLKGLLFVGLLPALAESVGVQQPPMPGGELRILDAQDRPIGACPLTHTRVDADIVGFVGRVTVAQTFHNPLDRKIEAVYIFPLPHKAAVDNMVMTVGDRRIVAQIKPRDEAREIYETARAAGHVAGLLDQERPNIFTQSVTNIEPGVTVVIEISYVETLEYEDGVFEWVFPMVVGPRYIPGQPVSSIPLVPAGVGWAPDTPRSPAYQGGARGGCLPYQGGAGGVPDASRITPPVVKPGFRAGHDVSLTVNLEAGMPLYDVQSRLHHVEISVDGPTRAVVTLKSEAEIPNKDFILHYRLATDEIEDAFLVHTDERGTFFTLILQPPQRVIPAQVVAREIIFVLDTSGSMSGFPIEKAKKVMAMAITAMRPGDTFNLITFAGRTAILWDRPRPATPTNVTEAQTFLSSRCGGGGTEMMKAINAALRPSGDSERLRIVCFMTDGYVGNDFAIIDAVRQNAGTTRVFSFGIGNSVNRFLLAGIAHAGRGEVEYVTLVGQADAAAERFHERILAPVLTDIEIDWGALPVTSVYPQHIPDLFSAKPLMIHGRLSGPAEGTITLRGNTGRGTFARQIEVSAPETRPDHDALASLWARAKVKDLMHQDLTGVQSGNLPLHLRDQITALGIEFRLMTQFTSFVAVEEMTITVGGEPTTITVPVEMPDGVSYEGVFGPPERRQFRPLQGSTFGGGGGGRGVARTSRGKCKKTGRVSVRKSRRLPPPARAGWKRRYDADDAREGVAVREPGAKLAKPLRGLAEQVEKKGKDGNLILHDPIHPHLTKRGQWGVVKDGKLRVIDYRVDVMIYLRDTSPSTIAALKKLGFVQTGESKAIKLLIGTIDVRKLEKLAKLEAVIRVSPISA